MKLNEFRQKYPEYDDVEDYVLVEALRRKHYPDVDFPTFAKVFGWEPPPPPSYPTEPSLFGMIPPKEPSIFEKGMGALTKVEERLKAAPSEPEEEMIWGAPVWEPTRIPTAEWPEKIGRVGLDALKKINEIDKALTEKYINVPLDYATDFVMSVGRAAARKLVPPALDPELDSRREIASTRSSEDAFEYLTQGEPEFGVRPMPPDEAEQFIYDQKNLDLVEDLTLLAMIGYGAYRGIREIPSMYRAIREDLSRYLWEEVPRESMPLAERIRRSGIRMERLAEIRAGRGKAPTDKELEQIRRISEPRKLRGVGGFLKKWFGTEKPVEPIAPRGLPAPEAAEVAPEAPRPPRPEVPPRPKVPEVGVPAPPEAKPAPEVAPEIPIAPEAGLEAAPKTQAERLMEEKPWEFRPTEAEVKVPVEGPITPAEAFKSPEAPISQVVNEKNLNKDRIADLIKRGEIDKGDAIRFVDIDNLRRSLKNGALETGISFEGAPGIYAHEVISAEQPFPAYGANNKHNVAVIIPEDAIEARTGRVNEVEIDPKVDIDRLRFLVAGDPKIYTAKELLPLITKKPPTEKPPKEEITIGPEEREVHAKKRLEARSAQEIMNLLREGHPKEEEIWRSDVLDEARRRGKTLLEDLGWPIDFEAIYRNRYTGDEEPLGNLLTPRFWQTGRKPSWNEVWSVVEHWDPAKGRNVQRIRKLNEELKQLRELRKVHPKAKMVKWEWRKIDLGKEISDRERELAELQKVPEARPSEKVKPPEEEPILTEVLGRFMRRPGEFAVFVDLEGHGIGRPGMDQHGNVLDAIAEQMKWTEKLPQDALEARIETGEAAQLIYIAESEKALEFVAPYSVNRAQAESAVSKYLAHVKTEKPVYLEAQGKRKLFRKAEVPEEKPPVETRPGLVRGIEKPLPRRKPVTIEAFPRYDELVKEIQAAIKKAPSEEIPADREGVPAKIKFKTDGEANIVNTKEALTKYLGRIKKARRFKLPLGEVEKPKPSKEPILKPLAPEKEEIGDLLPIQMEGWFTDGHILIKGEPPAKAKFSELAERQYPEGIPAEKIEELIYQKKADIQPVDFKYYGLESEEMRAASKDPLPAGKDEFPLAVFETPQRQFLHYQQPKLRAIQKRYPRAEFFVVKPEKPNQGMMIAYDEGKPVAAIMPMAPDKDEAIFREVPVAYPQAVEAELIPMHPAIREAILKEEKARLEAERKAEEEAAAPEEKLYDRFADGTDIIKVEQAPQGNWTFYRTPASEPMAKGSRVRMVEAKGKVRYWDTREEAIRALNEYAPLRKWKPIGPGREIKPPEPEEEVEPGREPTKIVPPSAKHYRKMAKAEEQAEMARTLRWSRAREDIVKTGTARHGDITVKIVGHPSREGAFGFEKVVSGSIEFPKQWYPGIEAARRAALEALFPKEKPPWPKGPSEKSYGYASVGTYATGQEQYAAPLKAVIDLPEIVEIAKQLGKGNLPRIVRRIRAAWGRAQGAFSPRGMGRIILRADIFKDIDQARAVLAHEVGHWIDYLPQKFMARGNILGRIASLKKYMKQTLPRRPGAKEELTEVDRRRLRYQAQKLIANEYKDKWIDEEIVRDLPITPDDVLAIWNRVEESLKTNPELYRFVQTLNTAEKKAIVKAALKGQVEERLRRFAKKVKEKTGKKIKVEPSKELIAKKYEELIKKEIEKLRLFKASEIMDELKTLSRTWKPFDPAADPVYTRYRYRSVELYADAISALFNAPGLLRSTAPNFYEGFFNYLEAKPEVKELYEGIQDDITAGKTDEKLTMRTYDGFKRGDDAYALRLKKRYSQFDAIMRELVDAHWMLIKKVRKVGERNIHPSKNPRFKLEEMVYSGSEVEWMLGQTLQNVIKPLEDVGLDWDNFGFYRLLKRVSSERAEVANPLGWHRDRALEKLKALETEEWEGEKWEAVKKADEAFNEIRKYLLDKAEKAARYNPEFLEIMRGNVGDYVTFDVAHYIEKRYGMPPLAKIFPQIGTFQEIANPATATLLKDIVILKAVNRQIAAESVVNFLQEHYPKEIRPADRKWNGRFQAIQDPPRGQNLGLIVYLKEGKATGYYVDRGVANIFERNPYEAMAIANILRLTAKPFRMLFTEMNPGFWLFNIFRDYWRAAQMLPKAKITTFLPFYLKAIKPSFRSVYGIPDDVAEQALKGNMLISIEGYQGLSPKDREIERLLARFRLMHPESWQKKILVPFGHFMNLYSNIGKAIERMPKIGGYLYLKRRFPNMPDELIGHIVRTRAGSPDFLRVGRAYPIYNNLLLFSNAIKEGYRGDYEAMANNPAEFWFKKAKYIYLPKLLMYAASIGLLGDGIKKIYDGVTDYDMANYIVVPLGLTPNGSSVYLRIPTDEGNRLLGGVLMKGLQRERPKHLNNLFDYMAGQAPTVNPAIENLISVVQYVSGHNPYDSFRGRYAIPEHIFRAYDERSHEAFVKWLANRSGSSIVYYFRSDDIERVRGELDEVLRYPFVSNIVGRFIKVSQAGIREKIKLERELVKRDNARKILDAKEVLAKIVNGDPLNDEDVLTLASKPDVLDRNFIDGLARKYGNVIAEEVWSVYQTGSTEEKVRVLQKIIELDAMGRSGGEYRWLWEQELRKP